jgi:hypothetical protein
MLYEVSNWCGSLPFLEISYHRGRGWPTQLNVNLAATGRNKEVRGPSLVVQGQPTGRRY